MRSRADLPLFDAHAAERAQRLATAIANHEHAMARLRAKRGW